MRVTSCAVLPSREDAASFHCTAGRVWMEEVQHRRLTSSQTCQEVTDDCEERAQGPDRRGHRWGVRRHAGRSPHLQWRHLRHHRRPALAPTPFEQEISLSVRWWKWRWETTHPASGLPVIPLTRWKTGQRAPLSQAPSIPFLLVDAKRLQVCHSDWVEISVDATLLHNNAALESMKVPLTCLTMSAEDIYNYIIRFPVL